MIEWLRQKLATWGWIAYEFTQRTKIIRINEFRSVHITYNYKGDVDIGVCNPKPKFKTVVHLKVAYPDLNTVELTKFLEDEEVQTSEVNPEQ